MQIVGPIPVSDWGVGPRWGLPRTGNPNRLPGDAGGPGTTLWEPLNQLTECSLPHFMMRRRKLRSQEFK